MLQGHHPVHCGVTIKEDAGGVCIGIFAKYSGGNTDTLTPDWPEISIGHANGSDWWYRSEVICACDQEVLIGS